MRDPRHPRYLVDLNACIALAVTAYGIMLFGGIRFNKLRGAGSVLKDFSLLLSISFRLFGSMIGGLLMTRWCITTSRSPSAFP